MPRDTASRRILLVEDEAMIAMLVKDMLEDLGHELVTVATRLEEAFTAVTNEAADVAILDLNLGGVLTYPVADALAKGASHSFSRPAMAAAAFRRPMPAERPCKSRPIRSPWNTQSRLFSSLCNERVCLCHARQVIP